MHNYKRKKKNESNQEEERNEEEEEKKNKNNLDNPIQGTNPNIQNWMNFFERSGSTQLCFHQSV